MIKVKFKNEIKLCPESWADVSFLQFAGHFDLNKSDQKSIVAYFLGVSQSVIERMSVIEYGKVVSALQFTNQPIHYTKPKLYTKDIGLDEVGKFERLKSLIEKPIPEQVYGSLNIYLDMQEHEVNELDAVTAVNLHTFFLRNASELQNGTTKGVIQYRLMKMLKVPVLAMWRKLGSFFTRSITSRGDASLKNKR
jgi:hypothetical protein